MMLWESAVLGVVQGLTEFLPVSSSAHLVLAQSLLPGFPEENVFFDVLLHLGTILAVIVTFRLELLRLARSLLPGGDAGQRRLVGWLVLGTLPAGVAGLLFRDAFHAMFASPRFVAAMLLVTGAILIAAEFTARPRRGLDGVGALRGFGVGVAQAFAIIPGISRSGATISAALAMGVRGEDAARFSFLLSIPAVLGAALLEGIHARPVASLAPAYALGMAAAFLTGLWAIRVMLGILKRGRLRVFAFYCFLVGGSYLVFVR